MTTEEKIEQVKDFRPIDDVFFEVLAEDKDVCQEILRIIMDDDQLIVRDVIVQSSERNIYGRSVRLDALCYLKSGKRVNIEVQRANNDDHLRRVRFNAASITVKESNAGEKFSNAVDVYIVYISEHDFFHGESPIYHIDKIIRETGDVIDDGEFKIFVNAESKNESDVSELMQCFTQKSVNNPKFPYLSNRVKELKTTEGGASAVCEVMEKYQAEAVKKADKVASIRTTVENYTDMNRPEVEILAALMKKFALSESEAIEAYEQYAPVLK